MASGPYANHQRGTWAVQYHDGVKWRRVTVVGRRPGWKPGDAMPKRPPPEAIRALTVYQAREDAARLKSPADDPEATVAGFLAAYEAVYQATRRPNSVRQLGYAVRSFLDHCRAAKVIRLADVTGGVCERWALAQAAAGYSLAYCKQRRALLAAAWAREVRRGRIASSPWRGVESPGKPARAKRGSWTPEEFARLVAECNPWLRDLLILGCHTGLRINALMHLEWSDIEWSPGEGSGLGFVVVRPELDKGKDGYRVPMSSVCHDTLARRLATKPDGHDRVLCGHKGGSISSNSHTGEAISAACRRAGLAEPDSPNHHMRRSFGRWAVLGQLTGRPIPVYVVSRWFGHHSIAQTEAYLALDLTNSQEWMAEASPGPA